MKPQVREHSRLCDMFEASLSYTVKPCIHIQANYHRTQKMKKPLTILNMKYIKYIYVCIIYILLI